MAKKNSNVLTVEEQSQLIDFLAEFTHDPVGFVYAAFPWGEGELEGREPDQWQLTLLQDIADGLKTIDDVIREAIASGHGIGKSTMVSWLILWAISTRENTKGVVTANTATQLETKTWSELAKWHRLFIANSLFTYTATSIFCSDKTYTKTWRIDAIPWSPQNPEAFAGLHNQGNRILIIFDEASAIIDQIWEVTEGALTDSETEIIWCAFGNPTRNNGRFYDCFHKFRNMWNCKQIDSRNVKISNKSVLNSWVETYGEDSDFVKVRVRGIFPSSSDCQMISSAVVTIAQQREIHKKQYEFAPVIIGCDPAWSGEDKLIVYLRQGNYSKILLEIPKNDNDILIAGKLAKFEDEYGMSAGFIDMGYGTGIFSALKTMGRDKWMLVSFAESPSDDYYANKRAEMWGEMGKWLKDGGCIEDKQEIYNDLIAPQAFINRRGKLQLESKDDMKKRGIPSPNYADALGLTFAHPVKVNRNTQYKKARRDGKTRKYGRM